MPLLPGKDNVGTNIAELHTGKTFARTKRKSGVDKARKQAIAIALDKAGKGKAPAPKMGAAQMFARRPAPPMQPPPGAMPGSAPPMNDNDEDDQQQTPMRSSRIFARRGR
jgi:hypothetical protein